MTANNDAALQKFRYIHEELKGAPYPGYRKKKSKNQFTEVYYFLVIF